MCDRARLAVSVAKSDRSPKPYAVFDGMMGKEYIDLFEMLGQFDNSLKNDEFYVYLQPVVDSMTGRITSAEALVRWNCLGKGIISPQRLFLYLKAAEIFPAWICMLCAKWKSSKMKGSNRGFRLFRFL